MISNKAKNLSSSQHIRISRSTGQDGERRFYDSCKSAGLCIKKANKQENIGHIDFVVNGATFDVKGLKSSQKQGKILLELKNVQGKRGWCNNQNAPEWIAFDFGAYFLCLKNADLFNASQKLCKLKTKVQKASDCLYKGYSRKDRNDLMTMITLQDALNECEHWFLPYGEYYEPMDLI